MALNPLLKKLVSQSAAKYKGDISRLSKLKEGRNVIRIIAPGIWQGQAETAGENPNFYRDLGVHWIKADENGKPLAVVGSEEVCYQRVSTVSAAIDLAIANAYDEDTKKLYESWKAKKSIILNVVNRDANDEVQVLELTPTTFSKVMDQVNLYDDSDINVLDHNVGMDLVITKTGKGLNTSYDVAIVPLAPGKSFKPVTSEQVRQAEDLDSFIATNYFRGEEQKALNAIATVAGIKIPQIGGPATPVAALTSQAATVADAPVAAAVVQPAAPAPTPAPAAAMTPEQMQAEIARQVALITASQAQQVAASTPAVAQPVQNVTADTSMSALAQDEQDALLAELNAIGN